MKTIDVLYPVRDMRTVDCKDLNMSMKFLKENKDYDINFCIFDVGYNKSEDKLKENIEYDFKYEHERWTKHYGLSKAINLGVKNLVETDIFIISEFTSLVPNNIIDKMFNRFELNKFVIFGEKKFLKKDIKVDLPFDALNKEENYIKNQDRETIITKRALFKMTSKNFFYKIGGYEEAYLDIINEEKDFILRSVIFKGNENFLIKNKVKLLNLYNDKNYKKKEQNLLEEKIDKYRKMLLLDKSGLPIVNRKRVRYPNKFKLTKEQIKHLYSIETSL